MTIPIVALSSQAIAGQPHPQMFQFLQDQATVNQAQDYSDCSRPYCEKGRMWTETGASGTTRTWKVIHDFDGKPVKFARLIEQSPCRFDETRWNLEKGELIYRYDKGESYDSWNQIDMDDIVEDHDRVGYPSTGQNESSCPFHGLQLQFQRWSYTHSGYVEAMVSVRNTTNRDFGEVTWTCDLYNKEDRLVGRGAVVAVTNVPKNAITTDTQSVTSNGMIMFQYAKCELVHFEERTKENGFLFRNSPRQIRWPDRGVRHWWNFNAHIDGEALRQVDWKIEAMRNRPKTEQIIEGQDHSATERASRAAEDILTKMGHFAERDREHLAEKLKTKGYDKISEPETDPAKIDDGLTFDHVFEVNFKDRTLVPGFFDITPFKGIDIRQLNKTEVLRYRGLIRVHKMADIVLYRDRCAGAQDDGNFESSVSLIKAQFAELPQELKDRAIAHEEKGIAAWKPFDHDDIHLPGEWHAFCGSVKKEIERGDYDPMFKTAIDQHLDPERLADEPTPNDASAWKSSLVQHLQRYKRYPSEALSRSEEGMVLLSFSIDRNGHVLARRIARSSGYADLDSEVMDMIVRADPLPAFPANMPQAQLDLTIPIRFSMH